MHCNLQSELLDIVTLSLFDSPYYRSHQTTVEFSANSNSGNMSDMLSFRPLVVIFGLTRVVALAVVLPCFDLNGLAVSKLAKLVKLFVLDSFAFLAFLGVCRDDGDDSKLSTLAGLVSFPFLDLEGRFEVEEFVDLDFFLLEWVGVFAMSRDCSSSFSKNSGAGL